MKIGGKHRLDSNHCPSFLCRVHKKSFQYLSIKCNNWVNSINSAPWLYDIREVAWHLNFFLHVIYIFYHYYWIFGRFLFQLQALFIFLGTWWLLYVSRRSLGNRWQANFSKVRQQMLLSAQRFFRCLKIMFWPDPLHTHRL